MFHRIERELSDGEPHPLLGVRVGKPRAHFP
ncbi:hypothetical protein NIES2100_17580 [Calothrix sp. NIES-2100]|nr:hypothetical protein NIES2100_17580 [Calothrix sp. NIES-2100]